MAMVYLEETVEIYLRYIRRDPLSLMHSTLRHLYW